MKVSLVVAMARNRVIGREGALPWRLPEDLKYTYSAAHEPMGDRLSHGRKGVKRPLNVEIAEGQA